MNNFIFLVQIYKRTLHTQSLFRINKNKKTNNLIINVIKNKKNWIEDN
jgi:hypothetical protein